MGGFSFWDILIVVFVLLLIFGTKRLPQMGRSIGGGIKEFKDSVTGGKGDKDDDDDDEQDADRKQVEVALGRPQGEEAPLEGDVVRERTPRYVRA